MMRVIKTVLGHVKDDETLSERSLHDGPLAELMLKYNEAAKTECLESRFGFPTVVPETLGRDFKFYMSKLTADKKIELLNGYLERHGAPPLILRTPQADEEASMDQEERRLKRLMLKFRTYGAIALVVMFFIVIGVMIALMVQNNQLPNNAIFSTIMSTAAEIIKVLFNSK